MYFKYDFKVGFKKNIICLFIVAFIVILSGFAFYGQIADEMSAGLEIPRDLNSMDYFLHTFAGMRPFEIISDEKFELPITWLLIHMILFYFTGKYPYSEIYTNHGANVLVKGGSRKKWFLSKWIWCIAEVMVYYLVAYLAIVILCYILQVPFSLQIKSIEYQNLLTPLYESTSIDVIKVLILPVISSIAAVSIQLVISLVASPVVGFIFMAILYISSAYYFTPVLIGNFSMLARSSIFCIDGLPINQTIGISIVISIASLCSGMWIFSKKDILEKKY